MLSGLDRSVLVVLAMGLVIFVLGLTLLPVVILGLLGIPLGLAGWLVVGVALVLTGQSEHEGALGSGAGMVLMLAGWAALPVGAVGVVDHVARGVLALQRTGVMSVAEPSDLAWWVVVTAGAATAIVGGLWLRMRWPVWLCVAVWLTVLGTVPLAGGLLMILRDSLPLTA